MPNTDLLAVIESVRREAFEQGVRLGCWHRMHTGTEAHKRATIEFLYKLYTESLSAPRRVDQALKGVTTRWTNT